MRWTEPGEGRTQTRDRFLFLPVEINGEVRWLEKCTVKEESVVVGIQRLNNKKIWGWKPVAFVDPGDEGK